MEGESLQSESKTDDAESVPRESARQSSPRFPSASPELLKRRLCSCLSIFCSLMPDPDFFGYACGVLTGKH